MINYILLAANQIPIVIPFESRKHYLSMMEDNNVDGLTKLFVQLQSKEFERVHDFIEMDKEQSRQLNNKKDDLIR